MQIRARGSFPSSQQHRRLKRMRGIPSRGRWKRRAALDHCLRLRNNIKSQSVNGSTSQIQTHQISSVSRILEGILEAVDVDSGVYSWRRSEFFWRMRATLGFKQVWRARKPLPCAPGSWPRPTLFDTLVGHATDTKPPPFPTLSQRPLDAAFSFLFLCSFYLCVSL